LNVSFCHVNVIARSRTPAGYALASLDRRPQSISREEALDMGHDGRAEFRIFRAADAIEADGERVELVGLTDADGQGIAAAAQAGLAEGAIVKVLFSDQASGVSITYAWLKSHYALPRHSHDADCAYLVLSGEARLGSEVLTTGDGFFVPAGHLYQYAAGPQGVEVVEFRTAATYNMRFSGNGERFWSRVAEISEKNREAWRTEGVPAIARALASAGQSEAEATGGYRNMQRPVQLLSAAWFDRLEAEARSMCRQANIQDAAFVLEEIYLGAPASPEVFGSRAPGYRLEFRNANVDLVRGVAASDPKADLTVSLAYSILSEVVLLPIGPELDRRSAEYAKAGLISVVGAFDRAPVALARLHDAMQALMRA
jgi:hypothetical protein